MTPIIDTHTLPYKNSTIVAFRYDTQTRIKFISPDGEELADTLYTNAAGIVFYGQGMQSVKGYFVNEKATIVAHTPDGDVEWTCAGIGGTPNDGKVVGPEGDVLWSADSAKDWKPSWKDLHDKPKLGSWSENQRIVRVDTWGQEVQVDNKTTVLKLIDNPDCYKRGTTCSYRKAVRLMPPERAGQQLAVINESASDVSIWGGEVLIKPNDEKQYAGAISVLNATEGVLLVSDHLKSGKYAWKAVNNTSLYGVDFDTNRVISYKFKNYAQIGSIDVEDASVVMVYCDCISPMKHSLRLKFDRDGKNISVINLTGGDLNLTNAIVGDVDADVECTVPDGKCTMCSSATIDGSTVCRFWALATGGSSPEPAESEIMTIDLSNFVISTEYDLGASIPMWGEAAFDTRDTPKFHKYAENQDLRRYEYRHPDITTIEIPEHVKMVQFINEPEFSCSNIPSGVVVDVINIQFNLVGGKDGQTVFVRRHWYKEEIDETGKIHPELRILWGQYLTTYDTHTHEPIVDFQAFTAGAVHIRCSQIFNNGGFNAVETTTYEHEPLVWVQLKNIV